MDGGSRIGDMECDVVEDAAVGRGFEMRHDDISMTTKIDVIGLDFKC